jgi:hypothetical protein
MSIIKQSNIINITDMSILNISYQYYHCNHFTIVQFNNYKTSNNDVPEYYEIPFQHSEILKTHNFYKNLLIKHKDYYITIHFYSKFKSTKPDFNYFIYKSTHFLDTMLNQNNEIHPEIIFYPQKCYVSKKIDQFINKNRIQQLPKCNKIKCETNNVCSICLDKFELGKFSRVLSCGHEFHKVCIDKWCSQSSVCPNCRETFI